MVLLLLLISLLMPLHLPLHLDYTSFTRLMICFICYAFHLIFSNFLFLHLTSTRLLTTFPSTVFLSDIDDIFLLHLLLYPTVPCNIHDLKAITSVSLLLLHQFHMKTHPLLPQVVILLNTAPRVLMMLVVLEYSNASTCSCFQLHNVLLVSIFLCSTF